MFTALFHVSANMLNPGSMLASMAASMSFGIAASGVSILSAVAYETAARRQIACRGPSVGGDTAYFHRVGTLSALSVL